VRRTTRRDKGEIALLRKKALILAALAAASLFAGSVTLLRGPSAEAVFNGVDISSAGPLTHIFVNQNLACQVAHTGDGVYEMYDPSDQEANCGTFVNIDGTTFGVYRTEFTPVSQTPLSGAGTSGSPYQVTTVVDAGTTGVRITETVQYVVGDEFYRTDTVVQNNGNTQLAIKVYTYADCYLGGSDSGYGYRDPVGGVVACTENANNTPPGRIEEWTPITPPTHSEQGHYSTVGGKVSNGTDLADTCDCTTSEDNGAALQWNLTLNASGGSSTVSHFKTFSPLGVGAPTPTPGGPSPTPGSQTPVKLKTHTPTSTATPEATDTPLPATDTPVASPTSPPPPPTEPSGGAGGNIHAPDTGSGTGTASRDATAWIIVALASAIGGAALLMVGRRALGPR
jgi:hypothetical protein